MSQYCDYGHLITNSYDYISAEDVLTHLALNNTPIRDAVYAEYRSDRKIGAIKVLRDRVGQLTGFVPGLKITKDRVEVMFREWDDNAATRSEGAQTRRTQAERDRKAQAVKDAIWSSAFISLSITEAARVADKLGL
jgi:hypothetical protein